MSANSAVAAASPAKQPRTAAAAAGMAAPPPAKPKAGDGVTKRLQSELMQLMMSKDKDATAFPDGDNIFKWVGTLRGGDDTPFEGLTYKLDIRFPADYPFTAPTITFQTPCFHPNVDTAGNICLDILKDKWSASLSVSALLHSLRSLLGDPNIDSPLNGQAASLWADPRAFRQEVMRVYSLPR
jgi:ubiquitin-conjugating enzyme E2 C